MREFQNSATGAVAAPLQPRLPQCWHNHGDQAGGPHQAGGARGRPKPPSLVAALKADVSRTTQTRSPQRSPGGNNLGESAAPAGETPPTDSAGYAQTGTGAPNDLPGRAGRP